MLKMMPEYCPLSFFARIKLIVTENEVCYATLI